MTLHTPINESKFTYSEYSSINDAYSKMINESDYKTVVESVVNQILNKIQKNGLKKIKKCYKKSVKLASFATQTAIKEACEGIKCNKEALNEACCKVKKIIDHNLCSACLVKMDLKARKHNPSKMKKGLIMSIKEGADTDDEEDTFTNEPDYVDHDGSVAGGEYDDISSIRGELDDIDRDVKNTTGVDVDKEDDSFLWNPQKGLNDLTYDNDDSKVEYDDELSPEYDTSRDTLRRAEDEFDSEDSIISAKDNEENDSLSKYKYVVTGIVIGMSDGKKMIGEPVTIDVKLDESVLDNMEDVVDFVNKTVGFYFEPNDYYCDFSKVRDGSYKNARLCAKKSLTSDSVQGSEALNKYFGNDGRYADYLYKADGTAKDEPSEVDVGKMSDTEKDLSVVKKFPTVHLMVWLLSTNKNNGYLREIEPDDFAGTEIRVIE